MRGRGRGRGLLALAAVAYAAALALNRSQVRVAGPSMEPALWAGDRLFTVPAHPRWLREGQVVVVRDPADPRHPVVKRLARLGEDGATVLGDAPERSTDSRHWGPLPRSSVRRIAVLRWPDVRSPLTRHDPRSSVLDHVRSSHPPTASARAEGSSRVAVVVGDTTSDGSAVPTRPT